MDKYIGKRLDGRYELREIIGVGGMAYVYKAYDAIDDRVVAVKILKDEYLRNEEFSRRFKNESKAIAILSHPNIVRVIDVSFGDNLQYIVMEYIDGITLKEYIEQQKVLQWKEVVYFITQILHALQHAHDKGIVHQDVKPQNILLLSDGTIKVTDFGIARFSRSQSQPSPEQNDKAIGSVHYISPEQARAEVTDEKSDVYSVGVMMYEMLTGQLPFESDNAVSVAIMQMQTDPKRPQDLNPSIPDGLEEITLKAMQKDPRKRYQSAAEMLYDIDEFKNNPSIRFEYKYFSDGEDPAHYQEAFTKIRNNEDAIKRGSQQNEDNEEEEKRNGPPIIPILAGIAGAVVLITLVILGVVFISNIGKSTSESGKQNVTVPNLVGKKYETEVANDAAISRDFTIKINQEYSDEEAGTIIKQYPLPDREVKIKTELTLYISRGQQLVAVPEIESGESVSSAKSKLQAAGFKVKEVPANSDSVETDCVIRTDPASGEKKAKGSTVTLYVSIGAEPVEDVTVPDVVGIAQQDAIKQLSAKGLFVDTEDIETVNHPSYSAGVVVSQSPAGGASVSPDTEIVLTVSSGYKDVDLDIRLPEVNITVDMQIYVGNSLWDSESNLLPSGSTTLSRTFTERSSSYTVTVRLAPSGTDDYQEYAVFSIDGSSGKVTAKKYNSFVVPEKTTAPTENKSTTTVADDDSQDQD